MLLGLMLNYRILLAVPRLRFAAAAKDDLGSITLS
jgi:hypothetical protein